MIGNDANEQLRQLFADQFEPDGDHYLYRKSLKGPPIRVSASERDGFIEAFNRSVTFRFWAFIVGTAVLIVLVLSYAFLTGAPPPEPPEMYWAISIGLGVTFAIYMAAHRWAWNRPARKLAGRKTLGIARSRDEMRRVMLARTTYGQIAGAAGTSVIPLVQIDWKMDLLAGWNLFWLCLAAFFVILSAYAAYRKWRYQQGQES